MISGNAGASDVILSYTDGTLKTVTSQLDGSYSLVVSEGWSGTITPTQPCFTFVPTNRTYEFVVSDQPLQDYAPVFDSSFGCASVDVTIGGSLQKSYTIPTGDYQLDSYVGVNGGPLQVVNQNTNPLVSSIQLLYRNAKTETLSELMGVPNSQLAADYWMPLYIDDSVYDSQIRFTNTSDTLSTTVNIYLGDNPTPVYSKFLGPSEADRVSLGLTGGPVHIESTTVGANILAGMRIIYKNKSSFDEIMALPTALLDDEYWFPFYNHNNVNLLTEVRVGVPEIP